MKNKRITRHILFILLGAVLLLVGFFLISKEYKNVSGLCIGGGISIICMNIGELIYYHYYSKNPAFQKQTDIDAKDERNLAIRYKAKAKAYDITVKLLMIIPFLMILADLPLWLILSTIAFYLFSFVLHVYFVVRYNDVM